MSIRKTRILTESALLVALSAILSLIVVYSLPQGGGITLLSMLPIILAGFRHGPRWGFLTGFVCSIIQMIQGFSNVMYCPTLWTQILCILLDYVIAFSVLGLAGAGNKLFSNKTAGIAVCTAAVCLLRFVCHYTSGIVLWDEYAPEGQPVWLYSLGYNGSYMLAETIITTAAAVLLYRYSPMLFTRLTAGKSTKLTAGSVLIAMGMVCIVCTIALFIVSLISKDMISVFFTAGGIVLGVILYAIGRIILQQDKIINKLNESE